MYFLLPLSCFEYIATKFSNLLYPRRHLGLNLRGRYTTVRLLSYRTLWVFEKDGVLVSIKLDDYYELLQDFLQEKVMQIIKV